MTGTGLLAYSLRTLHNSMVLPHIYYCNLAWGYMYKSNLKRIVILRKRALRIGTNLGTMPILTRSSRSKSS